MGSRLTSVGEVGPMGVKLDDVPDSNGRPGQLRPLGLRSLIVRLSRRADHALPEPAQSSCAGLIASLFAAPAVAL
jgi:hypothetical protein